MRRAHLPQEDSPPPELRRRTRTLITSSAVPWMVTYPLGFVSIVLPVTPVIILVADLLGLGLSVFGLHKHPLGLLLLVGLASGLTTAVAFGGFLDCFEFRFECNQ